MSLRLAVLHNVFHFTFIMSYQLNMVSLSALPCGTPACLFSNRMFVCARACVSGSAVPSLQQRELPVPGPTAWIGHSGAVWPSCMNTTQRLYQSPTNSSPESTSVAQRRPAKRGATVPISSSSPLFYPTLSLGKQSVPDRSDGSTVDSPSRLLFSPKTHTHTHTYTLFRPPPATNYQPT